MAEKNKIPVLLEFLFGEVPAGAGINFETAPAKNAGQAQRGASKRLASRWERDKAWGEAFDEWMAERGRKYKPSTTKQAKITWRRLLRDKVDYLVILNRKHFIDDPDVAQQSGLRIGTPEEALSWIREQISTED